MTSPFSDRCSSPSSLESHAEQLLAEQSAYDNSLPCRLEKNPDPNGPPTFIMTALGLQPDHFPRVISALNLFGLKYGAILLTLPPDYLPPPGACWPKGKTGNVPRTLKGTLMTQRLNPHPDIPGTYEVSSTYKPTTLTKWEEGLKSVRGVEQEFDMAEFWRDAAAGKVKNKRYAVDLQAGWFERESRALGMFDAPFNLLTRCPPEDMIPGVHSPYLYAGSPGTVFCWHLEDYHLFSANYHLEGAAKVWNVVPGSHNPEIRYHLLGPTGLQTGCTQAMRHAMLVSDVDSVPIDNCYTFVQRPGQMMITWPGAHHCGVNTGWNLAEAVNFATKKWVRVGEQYTPCSCDDRDGDVLELCMEHYREPAEEDPRPVNEEEEPVKQKRTRQRGLCAVGI